MALDLDKIQAELQKPRKKKKRLKGPGFAAQKKALEATGYMIKRKKKK